MTPSDNPPAREVEMKPFVSECCEGELCFCGKPAMRKVGETIFDDDPHPIRHELTAYVCGEHFAQIMGPAGARSVGLFPRPSRPQGEEGLLSFEAQLAERLNDPEWLAKWNADEEGLVPFQAMLTALRRDEGDSITLLCDNPDFNGQPNNAVECCGEWTDWKDRRFTGDSLLLAVRAAYLARISNQGKPSS